MMGPAGEVEGALLLVKRKCVQIDATDRAQAQRCKPYHVTGSEHRHGGVRQVLVCVQTAAKTEIKPNIILARK